MTLQQLEYIMTVTKAADVMQGYATYVECHAWEAGRRNRGEAIRPKLSAHCDRRETERKSCNDIRKDKECKYGGDDFYQFHKENLRI